MRKTLQVDLGDRSYPIHLDEGTIALLPEVLKGLSRKAAVGLVTDSNVGPLYEGRVRGLVEAAGLRCVVHTMPAGEEHKRLARIEEVCGTFLEAGLDRSSIIIALGGGVVGDIAGYAAASFMRGIPFIQIPTTIVAQVDSSVGGKTGVNHPLGKNTIGAFHQPDAVIIDMELLKTLPPRELRAGLAEAIKHGVIADEDLFAYMEKHAGAFLDIDLDALKVPLLRSCEIKAAIVAEDEKEHGARANLNYGHTFGHAIEAVSEYKLFLHGEAVAIGMCAAAALGRELGLVDDRFVARQAACIAAHELPTSWPDLPVDDCLVAMRKDKKVRAGTMKFVVPTGMGSVAQRTDISEEQAARAFAAVRGR